MQWSDMHHHFELWGEWGLLHLSYSVGWGHPANCEGLWVKAVVWGKQPIGWNIWKTNEVLSGWFVQRGYQHRRWTPTAGDITLSSSVLLMCQFLFYMVWPLTSVGKNLMKQNAEYDFFFHIVDPYSSYEIGRTATASNNLLS